MSPARNASRYGTCSGGRWASRTREVPNHRPSRTDLPECRNVVPAMSVRDKQAFHYVRCSGRAALHSLGVSIRASATSDSRSTARRPRRYVRRRRTVSLAWRETLENPSNGTALAEGPVGGGGLIGIQNSDQNAHIILQKQAQYDAYVRYRIAPLRLYDDSSSPGTLPLGLVVAAFSKKRIKKSLVWAAKSIFPNAFLFRGLFPRYAGASAESPRCRNSGVLRMGARHGAQSSAVWTSDSAVVLLVCNGSQFSRA